MSLASQPQGHPLRGKTSTGGPKFLNGRKGGAQQAKATSGKKITKPFRKARAAAGAEAPRERRGPPTGAGPRRSCCSAQ